MISLKKVAIIILALTYKFIEAVIIATSELCGRDELGEYYFYDNNGGYRKCSNCDLKTYLFAGSISCGACCNNVPSTKGSGKSQDKGTVKGMHYVHIFLSPNYQHPCLSDPVGLKDPLD